MEYDTMKKTLTITVLCLLVLLAGCALEWGRKNRMYNSAMLFPKEWPKPVYLPAYDSSQFSLGKKLFYDGILSADGSISCASCHQPFAAFAHPEHDFSHGIHDQFSKRNAPALINLAWMKEMHWDGAINHLEMQPLAPITDPREMGESINRVLQKLRDDDLYPDQFKRAFGDTGISTERMLKALAHFTSQLISHQSKYDRVKAGKDSFLPYEARGYQLFKAHCNGCHREPLFTDHAFRNNGSGNNRLNDVGRVAITLNPKDSFRFKVPTLRNVQVTGPYFHDGRHSALSNVIEHYTTRIHREDINLDSLLKQPIMLTKTQKKELLYFLYTLTDSGFLKNPRFLPDSLLRQTHLHSSIGNR
jgi:cytochrome c peroxidase